MKAPAKPALQTWAQFSMMGRRRQLVDEDVQEFLGSGVVWRRAVLSDMVLVFFRGIERSSSSQKFMSQFCFVRVVVLEDGWGMVRWDTKQEDRGRSSTSS